MILYLIYLWVFVSCVLSPVFGCDFRLLGFEPHMILMMIRFLDVSVFDVCTAVLYPGSLSKDVQFLCRPWSLDQPQFYIAP